MVDEPVVTSPSTARVCFGELGRRGKHALLGGPTKALGVPMLMTA